jgi:hypothetical protein
MGDDRSVAIKFYRKRSATTASVWQNSEPTKKTGMSRPTGTPRSDASGNFATSGHASKRTHSCVS